MKRPLLFLVAVLSLVLSGCASTVRSNVTAFNEWPNELPDKTFVFERTKAQDQSLEYRSYENLVRSEVRRLGLVEADATQKPALKLTLDYAVAISDLRTIQPVYGDPFFYGSPFYYPSFYRRGFYGYGYDPFWFPPVVEYRDQTIQINRRQLHVLISRFADGKSLYDVKVNSTGQNSSLPAVMPYLVKSAFADFPGPSGVTRTIDMKMN